MAHSRQKSPERHRLEALERRQLLASAIAGTGTGLIGNYYSDTGLSNLALTRVDPTINFDWGLGSPAPAVPADGFSAQWTGKIQAQYSETYTFYTDSDEGVALWVNGQQIIDNFTDHTLAEDTGTISLQAGELYDIRVAYYDNLFDATMKLSWSSPSTPRQIVPQSQLYGSAGWTSAGWLNDNVGGTSGSISSFGSTYNVAGGGNGTTGTSDGFEYLYQTLEGDGTIVAKVAKTQGTANGAEAGVMIRDSLDASSAYTAVVVNASGVGHFESRTTAGAVETNSAANQPSGNYWVKLVRDGNLFNGYTSPTGADNTWTYIGTQNVVMGQTVYAGVTATSGTSGGQNAAQFQNISIVSTPPLGAGLDAVRDYSQGNVFVDIAKQARAYQGPNLGPSIPTDANGWPMADFMTILLTGYANTAHLYNGTYHGSFNGQATIGTWLTPGGQIQNQVYNPATNTTTFDFIVNASESADGWYMAVQMTGTRRTPTSPIGSGITNLKMIRPGYDPNTTQIFQQSFLDQLTQFNTLRFMDWTATNNSTVVDWSQRTTLNSARQASNGVAWEYVVDLANQLQKNIWINIPVNANDAYVTQLAALLKSTLDPNLIVYVEYSNEVWNGIFTQSKDNFNAAVAEVNAGGSPLNADGDTNPYYWGWRRVAERLKQISDLFAGVWGQSAINARVRCVLAAQYANPLVLQEGLEFIDRTYGAPSRFFYAAAEAPYIAMGSIDQTDPNMTSDEIISHLQGSATSNAQRYATFDTFARRYGLVNMAYEGGPDVSGSNNLAAKKAAMLDPQMEQLVVNYLDGWYGAGGGLFNWFVAGPTVWNANGMWGLTNLPDNTTAPKILATKDIVNNPRTDLTYGISVPAKFDARSVVGATTPFANTYQQNPGKGKSFDYYVRAPIAGNYQIIFNAATADTNDQLRVAINDTDVRTITLANTGSKTSFINDIVGTVMLREGENLIHVTSVNEGAGWNLQTVEVAPGAVPTSMPSIASAASAAPMSITGRSTNLSILGADSAGESTLVYSWQALDESPTSVTFSANGTNAAKNTTATFSRSGNYTLVCTISDGTSSLTSSVLVTVNPVLTSISVAPSGQPIANDETVQLAATGNDQFGIQLNSQPGFVWNVSNGFGSISASGLYHSPASGLGTATVTATGGGITGTTTVITQAPLAAQTVANPSPGLAYNYYAGTFSGVPNFSTLTPDKTGTLSNISLSPATASTYFAMQFNGYVDVSAPATYTFYTNSDDGSKLWIDGQLVVNNDGTHGLQEKSGSIILAAGWHQFQLGYFQGAGGDALSVSYSSTSVAKQAIPSSSFEIANLSPTIATPASATPIDNSHFQLGVLGADDGGEPNLTYTWSATSVPDGASQPTFSANGTNASKSTIVTLPQPGSYSLLVTISDGTSSVTSSVIVSEASLSTPTVAIPAAASPSTVSGTSTQLSVLGADDDGEANLTYTWATTGNPPADVTFSANGTNASKYATATFTQAGTYNLSVTISDGALSTTSSVSVLVAQTLSSISVSPSSTIVTQGMSRAFTATAYDQFGDAFVSPPTFNWSVTGSGSVTQAGVYTAPTGMTPVDTVTASVGSISGSASVSVLAASQGIAFSGDADIGAPSIAGSSAFDGTTYAISASGADIFGTSDQFHYVYTQLTGDGQIIARVTSVQNTNSRAKAGVMFRETLNANSRMADFVISPDNSTSLQWRANTGNGTSLNTVTGASAPYWIKLVRSGNTFSAYRSPDGANWTAAGTTNFFMPQTLYVGLAVTSHDNTQLNTATFDHVQMEQGAQLSGRTITGPAQTVQSQDGTAIRPVWIGLDFGSQKTITEVDFTSLAGTQGSAIGGVFEASNSSNFSTFTDLYTIRTKPKSGAQAKQSVASASTFRYVRYIAPGGGSGGLSQISYIGF